MLRKLMYIIFYFSLSKIKRLKNIHKGETVYLIGDSAELKFYDLNNFDDHPAIFFNKSYLFEGVNNRKNKTYAVTVEPYYYWSVFKKTTRKNEFRKFFLKKIIKDKVIFFVSLTNLFLFFVPNIFQVFDRLPGDILTKELKLNGLKFNAGAFQASLCLAIYMGFRNIHIVGVSFHGNSFTNHWYKTGLGHPRNETEKGLNTPERHLFFSIIKKYIDGIDVITYTDSESVLLNTISYKKFTGFSTNYRETNEILEPSLLEMMDREGGF